MSAPSIGLEDLKAAIDAKWEAHRLTLQRSLGQGMITWRQRKDGRFEIKLKPDL